MAHFGAKSPFRTRRRSTTPRLRYSIFASKLHSSEKVLVSFLSIKKSFGSLILASIALIAIGQPVSAATTQGITVSPPTYELSANPGDTLSNTIRVTNESDAAVTLTASAQDFTVAGTEGSVKVADDAKTNAFASWFSFTTTQIPLAAKSSALVPFTIRVPKNAEPGGHFATVLFNPVVAASSNSTGASVIQRVGSLILMKVSGAVTEAGSIKSFRTKNFIGDWQTVTGSDGKTKIYVASGEDLNNEKPKSYFNQGPIAFDLVFKNSGNVHFKPAGTVTIYDIFGRKVDQVALDPRNVFPGGERRISVIWPTKSLWGGYYRAQVAAVYGSQNKILTAETVFWAFPLWVLIMAIVILVLLFVLRKRLASAARVLIKGR